MTFFNFDLARAIARAMKTSISVISRKRWDIFENRFHSHVQYLVAQLFCIRSTFVTCATFATETKIKNSVFSQAHIWKTIAFLIYHYFTRFVANNSIFQKAVHM